MLAVSKLALRDGGTLAYRQWGRQQDPTVLLFHSLAMTGAFWGEVAQQLVDRKFRVIAPDCRGHGASSLKQGLTVERAADDAEELLDALGVQEACVAGASMGGSIALAFAIRYGARMRSLGLVDTTCWYGEGARISWDERAQRARMDGLSSLVGFQKTRWFTDSFIQERPEKVEAAVELFLANDIDGFVAACGMLGACDLRSGLASISVPTIVIVGEEDYATPPPMAEFMAHGISGAELRILPRLRHLTVLEAPKQIAKLLLDHFMA